MRNTTNQNHRIKIYCLASSILKIWSYSILNAWFYVMEALIQVDSPLFDEIQSMTLNLTDYSQQTNSRFIGARLIGAFAEVLKDKVKGPLFDRARILCQDTEIEVRKVMAKEVLLKICESISTDLLETYVLEKVL